jgi:hypothetical protein
MTLQDALKILHIEKYHDRIINSNSHGELFHIMDYAMLAEGYKNESEEACKKFSEWFDRVVEFAEKNWNRPESVFQHISKIYLDNLQGVTAKT